MFRSKTFNTSSSPAVSRRPPAVSEPVLNLRWSRLALQKKPQTAPADDEYENAADAIADKVMRMPEQQRDTLQRQPAEAEEKQVQPGLKANADTSVQRLCSECEEELQGQSLEQAGTLQAKRGRDRNSMPPHALNHYLSGSDHGSPLSEAERRFFEPRFGREFSSVRLHTDAHADQAAQSINARAFTTGSHIVFASGEYAPQTVSGRRLLAHELTHTMQQGASGQRVYREQKPGAKQVGDKASEAGKEDKGGSTKSDGGSGEVGLGTWKWPYKAAIEPLILKLPRAAMCMSTRG